MKKLNLLIIVIFIIGCHKNKSLDFKETLNNYIIENPINIENYDYLIRFYKLNSDTLFEINQDRNDIETPLDFTFNSVETINGEKRKKFIFIGKFKINSKNVYLYDTQDSIGKNIYREFEIYTNIDSIEKINNINYPFIPKTKVYKFKNNKIEFIEERDSIRFK